MKNLTLFGFMVAGMLTGKLLAQGHQLGSSDKIKVFEGWVGHWKGEGTIQMGPGEPVKSTIDERIQFKLDGIILVVEGIGKSKDSAQEEQITHQAFAVLSFDQISGDTSSGPTCATENQQTRGLKICRITTSSGVLIRHKERSAIALR